VLRHNESSKDNDIVKVTDLLKDQDKLQTIRDLVETGASIGTIEAKMQMYQGQLKRWLLKGQEKKKTPYKILYNMYRSWAAEARAAAEAQQLAKTPSQWLERNSSSKLMDEPEEKNTQLITNNQGQQQAAFGAYQLLAAMKVLHNAGISVDAALEKDAIVLDQEKVEQK